MIEDESEDWRSSVFPALAALIITIVGCTLASLFWLRELREPSVTFLGSGSNLSVLVTDGPARFLLASGDDPIVFENAFLNAQPLFARRVDVLLVAGDAATLRVPEAARRAAPPRMTLSLGTLPLSAEARALQPMSALNGSYRIALGPSVSILVESRLPPGADALETAEMWRLTIEHEAARIVVYSDGESVPLFPPNPAAVVAISGGDPLAFMPNGDGVAFIVNATRIDGSELRNAQVEADADQRWMIRVHPGDAVRIALTDGGAKIPSWAAASATPGP